jgi:hypothetical protein
MNRRTFIKSSAAAIVAGALPAIPVPVDPFAVKASYRTSLINNPISFEKFAECYDMILRYHAEESPYLAIIKDK